MKDVKKLNKLPQGWKYIDKQIIKVDDKYYMWANNNKSRFGGEYQHALIEVSCSE